MNVPTWENLPPSLIEQAKRVDLVPIVKRQVKLTEKYGAWWGLCPFHNDGENPSFKVERRFFKCFGVCDAKGDAIAWMRRAEGLSFREAVLKLTGASEIQSRVDIPVSHNRPSKPELKQSHFWQRIWNESTEPRGSIVERYLKSRGLQLDADFAGRVLRFHRGLALNGKRRAGMVALYRDIKTDEPRGIHRTFLNAGGEKIERKMLGRTQGAAIKLSADAHVVSGLHIGEGIETCIAAMQGGFRPCWASGSASAMGKFPLLDGIEALTILAETGEASARAVEACGRVWLAAGRDVAVVQPLVGSDFNDVVRA